MNFNVNNVGSSENVTRFSGVNSKSDVTSHPNSPSKIDKSQSAEYSQALNKSQRNGQIPERDVKSASFVESRKKLVAKFVSHLYPRNSSASTVEKKYTDCLKSVKRLKQTAMRQRSGAPKTNKSTKGTKGKSGVDSSQNTDDDDDDDSTEQAGAAGIGAVDKAGETEESSFGNGESEQDSDESGESSSGRSLKDSITEELAKEFPDVTNQDNMLELLRAWEDEEKGQAESELRKAREKLGGLEDSFEKGKIPQEEYLERKSELEGKIKDLTAEIEYSDTYKAELSAIHQELHAGHDQEIKDGYNLIRKANEYFDSSKGGSDTSKGDFSTSVAIAYQMCLEARTLDDVLRINNEIFGDKNLRTGLSSVLELCGVDIKSVNPSRESKLLVALRDLLFRAEMSGQLYNVVGGLYDAMEEFIEEQKQEIKTEV